jgi:flagellar basal-body rod protein FlgC
MSTPLRLRKVMHTIARMPFSQPRQAIPDSEGHWSSDCTPASAGCRLLPSGMITGRRCSKYDPHHPDANAEGYISLPNINVVEEMVNMISATRSYEANVTAVEATKDMASDALDIGR